MDKKKQHQTLYCKFLLVFSVDCVEQKAKVALDNQTWSLFFYKIAQGKKPSFLCEMERNSEDVDLSRALSPNRVDYIGFLANVYSEMHGWLQDYV